MTQPHDAYFQYCVGYFLELWQRYPRSHNTVFMRAQRWGKSTNLAAMEVAYNLAKYAAGQPGTTMDRASMVQFLRGAGATSRTASALLMEKDPSLSPSATSVLAVPVTGSLRSSIYLPLRSLSLHRSHEV